MEKEIRVQTNLYVCTYTYIYISIYIIIIYIAWLIFILFVSSRKCSSCRIVVLSLLILNSTVSEVLKRISRFMSLCAHTHRKHGPPLYTCHRITGTHFITARPEINFAPCNRKIWLFINAANIYG